MSFPPNLGITNSFIIDSSCILFQEFPSLLPQLQLDQICSPFSKHRMNGYSRIKKSATNRSKSIDFADLSLTNRPTASLAPYLSTFKPHRTIRKITMPRDSIPEHDHENDHDPREGELFGVMLSAVATKNNISTNTNDEFTKRSISIKRSASVTDGYSRIHHQSAEESEQCGNEFSSHPKGVKKKGKFFRAFRRLFGM